MKSRTLSCLLGILLGLAAIAAPAAEFKATECEGVYPRHLQGICTDEDSCIYWSWTDALVKTDVNGHILQKVAVGYHHGDLCYHASRIYVAVNFGKFNEPPGQADSWVYVYDAETLAEIARHPLSEVVYGAGGIAYHDGKFLVVGGLPPDKNGNFLYEYDHAFRYQGEHFLASGYTLMGIQTAAYADGSWWFGCYGKPKLLLRANDRFELTGRWEFDAAVGLTPIGGGRFLIGRNRSNQGVDNQARVLVAGPDETKGLVELE